MSLVQDIAFIVVGAAVFIAVELQLFKLPELVMIIVAFVSFLALINGIYGLYGTLRERKEKD
jgi:hypothetical protein